MKTAELVDNWVYKSDKEQFGFIEVFKVLKPDENGNYVGDCEDFALTWLYLECDKSWLKMLKELCFGSAKLRYCKTKTGGGHVALEYKGYYVDNWSKKPVTREYMELVYGHTFRWGMLIAPLTLLNLLIGLPFK